MSMLGVWAITPSHVAAKHGKLRTLLLWRAEKSIPQKSILIGWVDTSASPTTTCSAICAMTGKRLTQPGVA